MPKIIVSMYVDMQNVRIHIWKTDNILYSSVSNMSFFNSLKKQEFYQKKV